VRYALRFFRLGPHPRSLRLDSLRSLAAAAGASAIVLGATTYLVAVAAQAPPSGQTAPAATAFHQPAPEAPAKVPEGFTPIFNGKDLTGWHVSKTNHHGTTPDFRVVHGVIVGTQNPRGKGGILLTDKKYKNFEVYMEVKPDWGCDSGLFLRSSEAGEAYQVTLDYLPGGTMGGIYGERLEGVQGFGVAGAKMTPEERAEAAKKRTAAWQKAWKREEWNSVRARIEGDVPRIQVWINEQLVTDFTDTANHAANGATDGMIAIQMHFTDEKTNRWVDAGFWRWRVIAVKELPAN
jgi:hypothetical protein